MARPRGILNRKIFDSFNDSLSGSGIMRARETQPDNYIFDVNQPVVQFQKNQATVGGAGRLTFAASALYIPEYTVGIGGTPGSGYTAPSDGIYQVDGAVAVSGAGSTPEAFGGSVVVDGVIASGTTSAAVPGPQGAAIVNIHGVVHAATSQVINVAVESYGGIMSTIGTEDLVVAPAANLRVVKLGSDELAFDG